MSERPGAVKGAPASAAERTLDGEDRSETIHKEGKEGDDFWWILLKRNQASTEATCVCQPWFYRRLVVYSFFRLSEGA